MPQSKTPEARKAGDATAGGGSSKPTTLLSRLLVSHAAPVLIVTCALALALGALSRISIVLTTLSEAELHSLQDEGVLHRAAWALDVEMRHAQLACAQGQSGAVVGPHIADKTAELARVRKAVSTVPSHVQAAVAGYLDLGRTATLDDACRALLAGPLEARRTQLDEQMTNLWVARLEELHSAVREKEDQARDLAVAATWVGIPLALVSSLIALWVAHRMARSVKEPLAELARMARRVGRGDFESPLHAQGPVEIVSLAEELERMRSQLSQLEALKQGFLASVSHELRTPLSKIREALALLQDGAVGPLDGRKARVVQIARTACEREIRMVTTLLDLSRLRAGSPVNRKDLCSIDSLLQRATQEEQNDAAQGGVVVELSLSDAAPLHQLDPVLMERAVANLIRNAVSVSQRGQHVWVERTLNERPAGADGSWICVRVSDEGPGVPAEIRDRLFDAFVTSAVSGTGRAIGVGIGLALAREVARAHGGDLILAPSHHAGATFELWLPLTLSEVEAKDHPPRTLGLQSTP